MKKVISILLALSLATMVAVPAFAADTTTTAYKAAVAAAVAKGATAAQVEQANTFYKELPENVSEKALNDAATVISNATGEATLANAEKIRLELNTALNGEVVIGALSLDPSTGKISASATSQGKTAVFAHVAESLVGTGTGAPVATAAGTGVIKNTGVSTAPVAILGLVVVSAIGVAAMSARKLNLIEE